MHYIWHYSIAGKELQPLKDRLEKEYRIPCKAFYTPADNRLHTIFFDIEETHSRFHEILSFLPPPNISSSTQEGFVIIQYYPVYSEEEYLSAKWLSVRSSFSKVIPENEDALTKLQCIYGQSEFGYSLYRHADEAGTYIVKSPVKWGRNHLASSVSSEYRLFCDDTARNILQQHCIKGIDFRPVIKKSSGKPIENLHQMENVFTVPDSGIVGLEYTSEAICDRCGMKMIHFHDPRYRYAIRADSIPAEVDFARTPPLFALCYSEELSAGYYRTLISQKLYRVLKENMLDRSLWFIPIDVV